MAAGRSSCASSSAISPVRGDDGLEAHLVRLVDEDAGEPGLVLDDQDDPVVGADRVAVVGRTPRASAGRRWPARRSRRVGFGRRGRPTRGAGRPSPAGGRAAAGTYSRGMKRVNVLPSPRVLWTRISPPSSLAISRLMDRPRPVPPYFRLVPVSACWNGSKMTRSLSGGMPIPVSVTENARTPVRPAQDRVVAAPARRGRLDPQADLARLGELEGVGQQVPEHLLQPLRVGRDGPRQAAGQLDGQRDALRLGDRRKVRST